jgi:hypothetical protein
MARVLELIRIRSSQNQRRLVKRFEKAPRVNPKVLELQTAMEILAEVFSIRISEVEEMLLQRSEKMEQWPEGFWLAE